MTTATIYGLFDSADPSKLIRYVGQTDRTAEERLISHRQAAKSGKNPHPVYEWMRTVDVEAVVLEECDIKIKYLRENHWIEKLRTFDQGFNSRLTDTTFHQRMTTGRSNISIGAQRVKHLRLHTARHYTAPNCPLCAAEVTK